MARLVRFSKNKILLFSELQSLIAVVACVKMLLVPLMERLSPLVVGEFDVFEFLIIICTFNSCFKSEN